METFASSLRDAWMHHDDFSFRTSEEEVWCSFGQRYLAQAEELCHPALVSPSHVTVNQAMLQLSKKYWEWFYVVPKSHRNRVDERGHQCIHAAFRLWSERLRSLELGLAPPMLFVPPPALPPVQPQLAGIYLGEIVEGGDEI